MRRQMQQQSYSKMYDPIRNPKPKKTTMRKIVIGGTPEDVLRVEKPKKEKEYDCSFCQVSDQLMFNSPEDNDTYICVNCITQLYPYSQKEKLKS